jgi:hypothetical protein
MSLARLILRAAPSLVAALLLMCPAGAQANWTISDAYVDANTYYSYDDVVSVENQSSNSSAGVTDTTQGDSISAFATGGSIGLTVGYAFYPSEAHVEADVYRDYSSNNASDPQLNVIITAACATAVVVDDHGWGNALAEVTDGLTLLASCSGDGDDDDLVGHQLDPNDSYTLGPITLLAEGAAYVDSSDGESYVAEYSATATVGFSN